MSGETVADVLIFIEDPGAANFLARLPQSLEKAGISCRVVADGLAIKYCQDRNINYEIISQEKLLTERYKFCLVGTSENDASTGLALIKNAKKQGVVSVGIVDMEIHADKRFSGKTDNPLEYAPDWLFVPDESTKSVFVGMGYDGNNILITGHPHLDYLLEVQKKFEQTGVPQLKAKLFPSLKQDQLVVGFVAEPKSIVKPLSTCRSVEYTLAGRGDDDFRTIIVLEELLDALKQAGVVANKPYTVVRLHPKNMIEEFTAIENEVDRFSSGGDPLEVIMACDVVFGLSSMLLQEAIVLNKPVISILPRYDEFSRLAPLVKNPNRVIYSRKELRKLINEELTKYNSSHGGDSLFDRFRLSDEERAMHLPSKSGEKIVEFIRKCKIS